MKVKRYILAVIFLVIAAFALFGFVLPMLFSAANTYAVLLGISILAVLIYAVGVFVAKKIKDLRDEDESDSDLF